MTSRPEGRDRTDGVGAPPPEDTFSLHLYWSGDSAGDPTELSALAPRDGRVFVQVGARTYEQSVAFASSRWLLDVFEILPKLYSSGGTRPGYIWVSENAFLSFRVDEVGSVLLAREPEGEVGASPAVRLALVPFVSELLDFLAEFLSAARSGTPSVTGGREWRVLQGRLDELAGWYSGPPLEALRAALHPSGETP